MAAPNGLKILGEKLRRARLRKGWTLRDVTAHTAGLGRQVDYGNISAYERGLQRPNPGTLLVLARALDLDMDDLLDGGQDGRAGDGRRDPKIPASAGAPR